MPVIHQTTNYDQFQLFEQNRPVKARTVYESIKKKNRLEYFPIIVNSDLYVIDGQHRLDAARRLGLEIYYIVCKDGDLDDIIRCQKHTNWDAKNYLHFYRSINENYKFIGMLYDQYRYDTNLPFLIRHCSSSRYAMRDFNDGSYYLKKDTDRLKTIFKNIAELRDKVKAISLSQRVFAEFLEALWCLVTEPKYDHEKMMKKIDTYKDEVKFALGFKMKENILDHLQKKVYNYYDKRREEKAKKVA